MNKEYSDNDILDLLSKTSTQLSPRDASFATLISSLKTGPSKNIIQKPVPKTKTSTPIFVLSPYSSFIKVASACMAVFVIYIGISQVTTKSTTSVSIEKNANQADTNIAINTTQKTEDIKTVTTNTLLAQKSTGVAADEVDQLTSALQNELTAEAAAGTALLAISDNI